MIATREQQKAKALELMKQLGLAELFIKGIEKSPNFVQEFFSAVWENPEVKTMLERLESEKGIFVYYVTHEETSFGECYSFLYVSSYLEDFSRQDIRESKNGDKVVFAWVENISSPTHSEFGSIVVSNECGVLVRVG